MDSAQPFAETNGGGSAALHRPRSWQSRRRGRPQPGPRLTDNFASSASANPDVHLFRIVHCILLIDGHAGVYTGLVEVNDCSGRHCRIPGCLRTTETLIFHGTILLARFSCPPASRMPPLGSKGKGRGRDMRRSRSRNTTPSSVLSAGTAPITSAATSYLDIDNSKLLTPTSPQYGDLLDRLESRPGAPVIPEMKHIETLVEQLRQLSESAEARSQVCDAAMRELADKRKIVLDEERERERLDREAELRRVKAKRESEEASDRRGKRGPKPKKRKDREQELAADGVKVKTEGKLACAERVVSYGLQNAISQLAH